MRISERLPTVLVLGTTQTLAWASSYYLPAILADPIAHDLNVPTVWFFGAFSASLLLAAVLGPRIGRTIDALGGRAVLSGSNVVFAAGLALLGLSSSFWVTSAAWLVLGLGMGLGLYDAAFATLGRIYGLGARPSITGITLIAGFASTIGWPLSSWCLAYYGWRETCFAWAVAHLVVGLPLNLFLLPKAKAEAETHEKKPHIPTDRNMWLLALAFALAWTVTGAMAAHFPRLLEDGGATPLESIAAGALIGPAQVAARLIEALVLGRAHPLVSGRLATVTHPLGAAVLGFFGSAGLPALAFAVLHGFGNGILTIARGTIPLAIFGPKNYGYRLGLLGAPARIAQAVAPLLFGVLIDYWGFGTLIVSSGLSLAALVALLFVRKGPPPEKV
jgi:MFS family permease